jgi:hypothetical protein
VPVSPVYDGTFFPSEMFLYCASNADLYVNAKESLVENVVSPLPVAIPLAGIPAARLAHVNSRGPAGQSEPSLGNYILGSHVCV